MNFNKHSDLEGKHAFLSPSNYHWINYTKEKLESVYSNAQATQRGTELHDLASQLIRLGQKLPRTKSTFNAYVNDAISFRMTPEQVLYFSDNCFGTADAISFQDHILRIHDLKTGSTPASMNQLKVYAAIFCLEYGFKPTDIKIWLRIYQSDEVVTYEPEADDIFGIMSTIREFDKCIEELKENDDA